MKDMIRKRTTPPTRSGGPVRLTISIGDTFTSVDENITTAATGDMVRPKFEAAGQARGLLRQLKIKFGVLPPKLVSRIKRARIETLDRWCDQFVTARVLDEVFAER